MMAATFRGVFAAFRPLLRVGERSLTRGSVVSWSRTAHRRNRTFPRPGPKAIVLGALFGVSGAAAGCVVLRKISKGSGSEASSSVLLPKLWAAEDKKEKDESKPAPVSKRELRYKDFASLSYKGEVYMTPRDFLESITHNEPRARDIDVIDDRILAQRLRRTPSRSKSSKSLFRDMWNDGILTYADYLFLLTALTKTKRQFEIAFEMFDRDKSDFVDLNEFERVQDAVTKKRNHPLLNQKITRSSLTVHLFGERGNQKLYSKDFFKFIENLQTEVREIEFSKYSGGAPTITGEDFAAILLLHTTRDLDPVVEKLKKIPLHSRDGISFEQFNSFCHLLNSLDDFAVAMTMYTLTGKPVTEDEFSRAAQVCTGQKLDDSVVKTVFYIFDVDGDGKLSYNEFLVVMKNWKFRGLKMQQVRKEGIWPTFKTCVKLEMRNN